MLFTTALLKMQKQSVMPTETMSIARSGGAVGS